MCGWRDKGGKKIKTMGRRSTKKKQRHSKRKPVPSGGASAAASAAGANDTEEYERAIMKKMQRDMDPDGEVEIEFEERIAPYRIDMDSLERGDPMAECGERVSVLVDKSEDILLQFQRLTGRQTSNTAILRVVGAMVEDDAEMDLHLDRELDGSVTGSMPFPDDSGVFVPPDKIGMGSMDKDPGDDVVTVPSEAVEGISHVDICIYRMKLMLQLARANIAVITSPGVPSKEALIKTSYSLMTLAIMRGTMLSIVDVRMAVATGGSGVAVYREKARAVERGLMEEMSEVLVQSSLESELGASKRRGLMKNTMGIFYAISEARDPTDIATSISIAMRESCAPRRGAGGISADVKSKVIDDMDAGAAGVARAMCASGKSIPIGTLIPAPQAGNRVDFLRPESNGKYPVYHYSGSMESAHTDAVRTRAYFLMAHIGPEPFNPIHDMPHIDSGDTFPRYSPVMCCDYGQCMGLARVPCSACNSVHYCSRNHRSKDAEGHLQICGESGPYVDLEVAVEAMEVVTSDAFSWCLTDEVVLRVLRFYDWCWRHLLIVNDGVAMRAITLSYGDDESLFPPTKTSGMSRTVRIMGGQDPSVIDVNIMQSMRQEKLPDDPFESIDTPELFWVRAGIVEACRYIFMRGAFNVIGVNFVYNGKTGDDVAKWFSKLRKVDDPWSGVFTKDIYQKAIVSSQMGRTLIDRAISIVRANSRDPDIKSIARTINVVLCEKLVPSPVGLSISILVTAACMADDDFFFMDGMASHTISEDGKAEEDDGIGPLDTEVLATIKTTAPLFIRPYLWLAYCDTGNPDRRSMTSFFRTRFRNAMRVSVVDTAVSRLCTGFLRVMVTKKRFAKRAVLIREGHMTRDDLTHIEAYRKAVGSVSGCVRTRKNIGCPSASLGDGPGASGGEDVSCLDIRYPHEVFVETLMRVSGGSRKELNVMLRGALGIADDIVGAEVQFASNEAKDEDDDDDDDGDNGIGTRRG